MLVPEMLVTGQKPGVILDFQNNKDRHLLMAGDRTQRTVLYAKGEKMKCKVYPSNKKHNRYIITASEKKVSDLPKHVQDEIGSSRPWKEIDLHPGRPLIGLDPGKAMKSIESHGYFVQEVTIIFKEKE